MRWFSLALLLAPTPALAERTVAVMKFASETADPTYQGLGTALAGMLVTDLTLVPGIIVVERERLDDLIGELKLSESRFIDPATAQKVGKGVGADLMVLGDWSVVAGELHLNAKLLGVESQAAVKSVSVHGPVADFVSAEKELVETLVSGLAVDLTMAVRRNLLAQVPTEDLEALASYGRGDEAAAGGNLDAARINYEAALREDPNFALAARALADLKAKVEAAQQTEATRYADAKTKGTLAALEKLPSELDRPASFKDTLESEIDLAIRWALLQNLDRSCALAEEMRHAFERRKGKWTWWVQTLPGKVPQDRWQQASARVDARAAQLGLAGPGSPYETLHGELMRQAAGLLVSPIELLVAGNLTPEKFSSSYAYQFDHCVPPAAQEAEWVRVIGLVERFGLANTPGWTESESGPSPVTVGVIVRLHRAFLRARAQGADGQVIAMTEAELARFPEGSPGRVLVLRRVNDVIAAGEAYERNRAATLGLDRAALEGAVRAIAAQAAPLHVEDPLCAGLVKLAAFGAKQVLTDLDGARKVSDANVASPVTAPWLAGCLPGQTPRSTAEILKLAEDALARPHPHGLADAGCTKSAEDLRKQIATLRTEPMASRTPDMIAPSLNAVLGMLQSQRERLCLAP